MHPNLKCISCYSTGQPRLSLCENKEIALTHDFNRGNSEKKQTVLPTVSTVFTIFKHSRQVGVNCFSVRHPSSLK